MGPRSLDGDVVSRRRVFDHAYVEFARLTERKSAKQIVKMARNNYARFSDSRLFAMNFLTKPLNLDILKYVNMHKHLGKENLHYARFIKFESVGFPSI